MIFQYRLYLVSILLIIFLVACSSVKKENSTLPKNISPNSCRINGTIINVGMIDGATGPCAEYPCLATIKINNVIGTGFNFQVPLIKNDTIKVKYEFTLSKTSKELFPTLNYVLPGLSSGDEFIADVEIIQLIQLKKITNAKIKYKIYNYDKID